MYEDKTQRRSRPYSAQSAGLGRPALCLELRKSVLSAKHGIDDDEELTRMVCTEAVARKEKKWG